MGLREGILKRAAALMGVAAFASGAPRANDLSLDDARVEAIREARGGQLAPRTFPVQRWYLSDVEIAERQADAGKMKMAAQLCEAMRGDGILTGILSTRSGGILSLPRSFLGDAGMVGVLEGRDGDRSVFDAMCPAAELQLLAEDGILLGVGVAELVPVEGRDYPVLVRQDPQFLEFREHENRWYFLSIAGPIPITPGDGRWVLHIPGGRVSPWKHGLWKSLARSYVKKTQASLAKALWEQKLANPARVAYTPAGATYDQRDGFIRKLMAWGFNSVFELPPGWEAKLLESNGVGFKSFDGTMERSDREYAITLVGQVVTIDGGAGFSNSDVHKAVRADLIKATAEPLDHTINTQILPSWAANTNGIESIDRAPTVKHDTRTPEEIKARGEAMSSFGAGVTAANAALAPYGVEVDAPEMAKRNGLQLRPIAKVEPKSVELEDDADDESETVDEPKTVLGSRNASVTPIRRAA